MKTTFFSKLVVLLSTTILLFACSEINDLDLNYEFAKEQEVSTQVDEETFVSLDKATEIADLFFSELTEGRVSTKSASRTQRSSTSIETLSENSNPLMYIINYPNGGFVIMGTTKNYYPVLAYSNKNSFDITSEMNGVSVWLEETKEALKTSNSFNDTIKTGMQNLWKSYETADIFSSQESEDTQLKSTHSSGQIACWNRCDELQMQYGGEGWNFAPLSNAEQIFDNAGFLGHYQDICYGADFNHSPLDCSVVGWKNVYKNEQVGPLLTTKWHQGSPYNDLCNGKPAGCGAIAVAQVMKHYHYPQLFNWNSYAFNWSTIPVVPVANSDHDALVRLVGHFVNMHYNSGGSWATPGAMEDGISNLGYNVTRANHNYERVKTELLNRHRPVMMGGNANNVPLPSPLNYIGKSHYWVCDGARAITTGQMQYFTEWQPYGKGVFNTGWNTMNSPGVLGGIGYLYFHMNWGWGGNHDGWFAFNNVNSGNGNYQYARQNFYITKP